ncbi:MAG: hypothetical protein U0575_15775 [Phycisphaerales bacterium]
MVDIYWLAMPEIPRPRLRDATTRSRRSTPTVGSDLLDPLNYAVLLGMIGLFVAATVQSLRSRSLVPTHDPRLAESLAFENI